MTTGLRIAVPACLAAAALLGAATGSPAQQVAIGVVLPLSGSPSNQAYSRLFLEGAEVAVAHAARFGITVELVTRDSQGTASGSSRAALALAATRAVAILGPLHDGNVAAAAAVMPSRMPLLSPTATRLPSGAEAVYSLGRADPDAARVLAEAVALLGHDQAVVIRPRTRAAEAEAAVFREAFREQGGIVTRTFAYAAGATTFAVELEAAKALEPPLVVVMSPASDVELLAPQIAFHGLDTLDIEVAGTAAWTAPSVLEAVSHRHTDRVVSVSPLPPDAALPGPHPRAEFVAAYEDRHRVSLRSAVPAVGYDMVRMVLEACVQSRCRRHEIAAALDELRGFRGATGVWSASPAGLVRDYFAVQILDGRMHPVGSLPAPPSPS